MFFSIITEIYYIHINPRNTQLCCNLNRDENVLISKRICTISFSGRRIFMEISHNLVAMNAMRMQGIVTKRLQKVTEKLSSGYRINRAADDAAGLSISEKMRRQIRGLTQASLNAQDGISMVQTADGAMAEVHDMLHRGSELCIKAANGTLSDTEREYIQQEISQLKTEIDGISDRTTFNEIQILKGKDVPFEDMGNDVIVSGKMPAWVKGSALSSKHLSETYTDNTDPANPVDHAAAILDFTALDKNPARLKDLDNSGFYTTCCTCSNHYSIKFTTDTSAKGEETSGNHYIYNVNITGVKDSTELMDRIIAATSNGNPQNHYTHFEKNNGKLLIYDDRPITQIQPTAGKFGPGVAHSKNDAAKLQGPTTIELQIGAEAGQHLSVDLPSISCLSLGIDSVDASTIDNASDGITLFKESISYVSQERSRMGAYQNRLEHTIRNLDNIVENTLASESAIRDTDMAKLMVQYANDNILMQAGQAMLTQANQINQGVLSLLG